MHVNGAVRQRDALWRSRAATGVKELSDRVFVVREDIGTFGGSGGKKFFVLGIEVDGLHARPRFEQGLNQRPELRFIEQNFGFGMAEDPAQFGGRQPDIEGHHHPPRLNDAVIPFEELMRIEAEVADSIRLFDPKQRKGGSQALTAFAKLGVSKAFATTDYPFFPAVEIYRPVHAAQRCQRNLHAKSLPIFLWHKLLFRSIAPEANPKHSTLWPTGD